jgi:DNA helicase-2/ATP-dependent DNA helicase PcrA
VSLWAVISQPVLFHLELSKATFARIESFRLLIEGWMNRVKTDDAYQLGHDIIMQSGISKEIYGSRNPEDMARQENLEEFLGGMQDFVESRREEDMGNQVFLPDFLQEVSLLTDLDSDGDNEGPKVSLMTVHAAKGLEFPTVFVVGLEENIFPSPMCTNTLRELEEERRLLYVAITRAEKHCILTCAQNRFRYGRMEYDTPSRFIRDIDPALLFVHSSEQNAHPVASQFRADPLPRMVERRRDEQPVESFSPAFKQQLMGAAARRFKPVSSVAARTSPVSAGASSVSAGASSVADGKICEGCRIEHQRFGVGTVQKIEGTGENMKATVSFQNAGVKQLLLKFAKFTILK